TGLTQRLAYGGEGPAQLHDCRGIGVRKAAGELWHRQGSGQYDQDILMPGERGVQSGRGGGQRRNSGHDLTWKARREPVVKVHIRAVEQRVTLGEYDDTPARLQVFGPALGRFVVKIIDRAVVAERMISPTCRDRIYEQLLDHVLADQRT